MARGSILEAQGVNQTEIKVWKRVGRGNRVKEISG